jgi:hypothetical protein
MPEDRKTSINNLIIVWQGQSWSIIAPNGEVLARCKEKRDAFEFAKGNTRHILYPESVTHYLDEDFIEFAGELPQRVQTYQQSWSSTPSDGEFDNLPGVSFVGYDSPKRKRMPVPSGDWLQSALRVAGFGALVIIGTLVLLWVVGGVGPVIAEFFAAVQAEINSIDWRGILTTIAVIIVGLVVVIFVLPAITSAVGEMFFDVLPACLPIVLIGAVIIVVLFLCRIL